MARTERSEKELSRDINAAIAGTEDEIFTDAMGDDELDNDGDTSLEEMGEGLEGDHLDKDGEGDDEDAGDEEDAEDKDAEEEDEASEDDEENEVRAGEEEQVRDDRGRFDRREPRIPPERLRHEAEQRRQAEQRAIEADQRYLTLEARFNDMQQRIRTAAKTTAKPSSHVSLDRNPAARRMTVIAVNVAPPVARANNKLKSVVFRKEWSLASTSARTCSRRTSAPRESTCDHSRHQRPQERRRADQHPARRAPQGPAIATGTLVGNEEAIDNYGDRAWIDWARNASRSRRSKSRSRASTSSAGSPAARRLGQGAAARRNRGRVLRAPARVDRSGRPRLQCQRPARQRRSVRCRDRRAAQHLDHRQR
jgi:hypothetical protein